jgi:uncharacterized membrane protein
LTLTFYNKIEDILQILTLTFSNKKEERLQILIVEIREVLAFQSDSVDIHIVLKYGRMAVYAVRLYLCGAMPHA